MDTRPGDAFPPAGTGASAPEAADGPEPGSVVAIVPVGTLEGAKSRLGEALDAEERRDLVTDQLRRTIRATNGSAAVLETIVVTPDDDVRAIALAAGARPMRQRGRGLNKGLTEARDDALAGGAGAILVVPVDLPLVTVAALADVLRPLDDPRRPLVVLVPDRHGRGTNALLVAPPGAIEFCFGGESRAAHAACAREAGARLVELLDSPLALDLDTPEDLLLLDARHVEPVDAL